MACQICEWRGEIRLIDANVSMRDRHAYYSLQLKKKKHVIHPMFTGHSPFLLLNQQFQGTEEITITKLTRNNNINV